jgi:hypothetical protein
VRMQSDGGLPNLNAQDFIERMSISPVDRALSGQSVESHAFSDAFLLYLALILSLALHLADMAFKQGVFFEPRRGNRQDVGADYGKGASVFGVKRGRRMSYHSRSQNDCLRYGSNLRKTLRHLERNRWIPF